MDKVRAAAQAIAAAASEGGYDLESRDDPVVGVEDEEETASVEDEEQNDKYFNDKLKEIFGDDEFDLNKLSSLWIILKTVINGVLPQLAAIQETLGKMDARLKNLERLTPEVANFSSGSPNGKECRAVAKEFLGRFELFPNDKDIQEKLKETSLKKVIQTPTNRDKAIAAVSHPPHFIANKMVRTYPIHFHSRSTSSLANSETSSKTSSSRLTMSMSPTRWQLRGGLSTVTSMANRPMRRSFA